MQLINKIVEQREVIFNLIKNDFKSRYVGNFLGIIWAFVQPIVTILIYAFIFGSGLRSSSGSGTDQSLPFMLYLISGIIPYFFFNDAVNSASNSIIEYSYILKKMTFNPYILPIIKIGAAFIIHIFFIFLTILIFLIYGYPITFSIIQLLYYSFCLIALSLSISYISSCLVVFFKDFAQIVSIALQFLMWLTPIMYDITIFSPRIQAILRFNPLYYIVRGYRDAYYQNTWFFDYSLSTLYFWIVVIILFVIGIKLFSKLKNSFADVL